MRREAFYGAWKRFYHVETRDCYGKNYAFDGVRNGHWAVIFVNSYTGEVWRE